MKRIAAISVGVGLIALLIISMVVRSGKEGPKIQPRKAAKENSKAAGYYVPPKNPGPPAPPDVISKASEESRVKSTYLNFRTAVATENQRMQHALRKVLKRNQEIALRCAQEDLLKSTETQDREIAQKTLEALRK